MRWHFSNRMYTIIRELCNVTYLPYWALNDESDDCHCCDSHKIVPVL